MGKIIIFIIALFVISLISASSVGLTDLTKGSVVWSPPIEFPSLVSTYHNASQPLTVEGTIDGGSITDTQHPDGGYDGVTFNFSEVVGSPGLDLRMNFTDLATFSQGVIRYKTSSLAGDYPVIQMWNYDDSIWEDYPLLSESESFSTITQPVFDSSDHLKDKVAQMRIYKSTIGNANNHYYVDWVAVISGPGIPSGVEVDPYFLFENSSLWAEAQDKANATMWAEAIDNSNATLWIHVTSTGEDHSWINQSVTTNASVIYKNLSVSNYLEVHKNITTNLSVVGNVGAGCTADNQSQLKLYGSDDTEIMFKSGSDDSMIFGFNNGENKFEWRRWYQEPNLAYRNLGTFGSLMKLDNVGNLEVNPSGWTGGGKITSSGKATSGTGISNVFQAGLDLGGGVGQIGDGLDYLFRLENAGGSRHDMAKWEMSWVDPTDTSEDSQTIFYNMVAGSFAVGLNINGSDVIIPNNLTMYNETGGEFTCGIVGVTFTCTQK